MVRVRQWNLKVVFHHRSLLAWLLFRVDTELEAFFFSQLFHWCLNVMKIWRNLTASKLVLIKDGPGYRNRDSDRTIDKVSSCLPDVISGVFVSLYLIPTLLNCSPPRIHIELSDGLMGFRQGLRAQFICKGMCSLSLKLLDNLRMFISVFSFLDLAFELSGN